MLRLIEIDKIIQFQYSIIRVPALFFMIAECEDLLNMSRRKDRSRVNEAPRD